MGRKSDDVVTLLVLPATSTSATASLLLGLALVIAEHAYLRLTSLVGGENRQQRKTLCISQGAIIVPKILYSALPLNA